MGSGLHFLDLLLISLPYYVVSPSYTPSFLSDSCWFDSLFGANYNFRSEDTTFLSIIVLFAIIDYRVYSKIQKQFIKSSPFGSLA